MKIRCRNCNTAFEYDTHEGFCPRCGSFNEKPVKQKKPKKEKKIKRAMVNGKERRHRRWTVSIIVILLLIPSIGIPAGQYIAQYQYKQTRSHRIESEELVINEGVTIHDYEYKTLKTEWHAINSTQKFLQVEYKLDSIEAFDDGGPRLRMKTKLYLYADGVYIEPYPDRYSLRLQLPNEDPYTMQMSKDEYTAYLDQSHGSLAFIAPMDAKEVYFLIVVYDDDLIDNVVCNPIQKWVLPIQEVAE